jgi:hypothetical protein
MTALTRMSPSLFRTAESRVHGNRAAREAACFKRCSLRTIPARKQHPTEKSIIVVRLKERSDLPALRRYSSAKMLSEMQKVAIAKDSKTMEIAAEDTAAVLDSGVSASLDSPGCEMVLLETRRSGSMPVPLPEDRLCHIDHNHNPTAHSRGSGNCHWRRLFLS